MTFGYDTVTFLGTAQVAMRVKCYALRSHHRALLSPALRAAAANVAGEPAFLAPHSSLFGDAFLANRADVISSVIVLVWAGGLLNAVAGAWIPYAIVVAGLFALSSDHGFARGTVPSIEEQHAARNISRRHVCYLTFFLLGYQLLAAIEYLFGVARFRRPTFSGRVRVLLALVEQPVRRCFARLRARVSPRAGVLVLARISRVLGPRGRRCAKLVAGRHGPRPAGHPRAGRGGPEPAPAAPRRHARVPAPASRLRSRRRRGYDPDRPSPLA